MSTRDGDFAPGQRYEVFDGDVPGWVRCRVDSVSEIMVTLAALPPVVGPEGLPLIYGLPKTYAKHLVRFSK